jgi:hypothetical protein
MKNRRPLFVTKASGESATFSESKLKNSMKRAGASKDQINEIIAKVSQCLYQDIPTKKIYGIAFSLLRKSARHVAAKYHLKKAIMELGPSGFPFEKYVGEILRYQGYEVRIGETVKGKCVSHEIDVIAEKDQKYFMIECKYHNLPGTVCNVKIPLYIQARFKDVESSWLELPGHEAKFHQGWVVTNTSFTHDAIQYGNCAGLKLLGWNYPGENNLRSQIDKLELYPITCLTSLTQVEKQHLLDKKIVLCREVYKNSNLLLEAGVKPAKVNTVLEEAFQLCKNIINRERN